MPHSEPAAGYLLCSRAHHPMPTPFVVQNCVVFSSDTYEAQTFTLTSSSKKEIVFGPVVVTSNFGSTENVM